MFFSRKTPQSSVTFTVNRHRIQLGQKVKDCVTGFEGIATGRAEYLTGCEQYLVVPQTRKPDGDLHEPRWFDVDRLEIVGDGVRLPAKSSNGPDVPAPVK